MSNPQEKSIFPSITLNAAISKKQPSLDSNDPSLFAPKKESGWDRLKKVMSDHYRDYRDNKTTRNSQYFSNNQNDLYDPYDLSSIYGPGIRAQDAVEQFITETGSSLGGPNQWFNIPLDWALELGPKTHHYTKKDPVTQDLMKDEGVQQARKAWLEKGTQTEPYKYKFGLNEYGTSLLQGDGTANVLGSYDIHINRMKNGKSHYRIENTTGWQSGTRSPIPTATRNKNPSIEELLSPSWHESQKHPVKPNVFLNPQSILKNREREEYGPGGNFKQIYEWDE